MTVPAARTIYRYPPHRRGNRIFLAHEVADRRPWPLAKNQMDPLWLEAAGEDKIIAILDTGLWQHSDLPDPVFAVNFSESKTVYDRDGHGTHVAGTAGARQNGRGVIGWAPRCLLGCVKVLGDDGSGTSEAIADGMYYARDQGAHIINMSLGGGFDPIIAKACRDVVQSGVFVICAAGNEGAVRHVNTVGWPARLPETLAIGAHRKDGTVSEFSSRGKQVDMSFPGEDILSTWPKNTYRSISGTSMATPAACGLTAVMLSYIDKQKAAGKVVKLIRNNNDLREHWAAHAIDAGAPGKDIHYGWGYPNLDGIVRSEPSSEPEPAVKAESVDMPSILGKLGMRFIEFEGEEGIFLYLRD